MAAPATAPIRPPTMCLRFMGFPPTSLWHDFKASHHRVVLVDGIVAMDRVVTDEVPELHEYLELTGPLRAHRVVPDPRHVFPGDLIDRRALALPGQDLVLLEMDMDRVQPSTAGLQCPDLGVVLFDVRPDHVGIERLPIDHPGPARAFEL